jgi:dihydrofolate reductase
MSKISIIVAAANNGVIGKGNTIPWRLPTDMKYFKEVTSGSTVIMGRKCWESIPAKFRPLPNRHNIVVTRDENYVAEGAEVVHDLVSVLNEYSYDGIGQQTEAFVIGGSEIYEAAFKYADKLYYTVILADIEGDILLKGFDPEKWKLVESSAESVENGLTFKFDIFERP